MTEEQSFWLVNAVRDHGYTDEEAALVLDVPPAQIAAWLKDSTLPSTARWTQGPAAKLLPYPGVRHPRIGFLEGAVNPERGTKASLFAPWDERSYLVVDVPEAIFSNLGLLYLAHTHVPTIWSERHIALEPVEWTRNSDGSLEHRRALPNDVAFGARITPRPDGADLEMWLRNGTSQPLTGLRTQVCVLLKGAAGFAAQTADNKIFAEPVAVTKGESSDRYILTAWDHCTRTWGNPRCPCMHSDPAFPDCLAGQTVRVRGRIVFYQGTDVDSVIRSLRHEFRTPSD